MDFEQQQKLTKIGLSNRALDFLKKNALFDIDDPNLFLPQPRAINQLKKIFSKLNINNNQSLINFQNTFGGLIYDIKKLPTRGLDCGIFITEKDRLNSSESIPFEIDHKFNHELHGEVFYIASYNISAPEGFYMNKSGKILFGDGPIVADSFNTLIEVDSFLFDLFNKKGYKKKKRLIYTVENNIVNNVLKILFSRYDLIKKEIIDSINEIYLLDNMVLLNKPHSMYEDCRALHVYYNKNQQEKNILKVFEAIMNN